MMLSALLLCAWLGMHPEPARVDDSVPLSIDTEVLDGSVWWTIRASNVTLGRMMERIVEKSGHRLAGLPGAKRTALVSADLERRPLDQVLEYVLGSVGLRSEIRGRALVVSQDDGLEEDRGTLLDAASAAWIRAVTRFPDAPSAPSARLAQGGIAEMRGQLSTANDHYQTLIETYPSSNAAMEALMRSGRIQERLGNWKEASLQFRELVDQRDDHEYSAGARLELARCMIHLENAQSARFLLDNLDSEYPTSDPMISTERRLVRAEALNALGRYMDALRLLDRSARDIDRLAAHDVLRVRAAALEGIGLPGEAARSWFLFAQDSQGKRRIEALENAARLALDAADELAVLFICKEAGVEPLTEQLTAYRAEARRRLGFDGSEGDGATDVERQLSIAGQHLARGEVGQAASILRPLFAARDGLDEELAARISVEWARWIERTRDLPSAISILAGSRTSFDSLEARKIVDLGAAALFEKNELFGQAAEAYRGVYDSGATSP